MIKSYISLFKKHLSLIMSLCFISPILIGFITGIIYYLITNPFSFETIDTSGNVIGAIVIYTVMYPIKIIFQGFLTSLLLYCPFLGVLTILMFSFAFVAGILSILHQVYILIFYKILKFKTSNEKIILTEPFFGALLCFCLLYYALLPVGIREFFGDGGEGLISMLFNLYLSHLNTIISYFI